MYVQVCVCVCGKLSNDAFSWHQQQLEHGGGGKAAQNKQRYIDTYGGVSRRKYALILREGEKSRRRASQHSTEFGSMYKRERAPIFFF